MNLKMFWFEEFAHHDDFNHLVDRIKSSLCQRCYGTFKYQLIVQVIRKK